MAWDIKYRLEEFEGPLDLLLTLVQKNKMDLFNIEIVRLIDQYLAVMEGQTETIDAASEFISMAARFVQMKSAMLLPKSEEAERMRQELSGLLVEYSACKEVAAKLKEMAAGVHILVRKPAQIQLDTQYKGKHSPRELTSAFKVLMGKSTARRMPSVERFDEIVTAPIVSVAGRVIHLLKGMTNGAITKLMHAFGTCRSRGETVATFLALLELIRAGRVAINDEECLEMSKRGARREQGQANGN